MANPGDYDQTQFTAWLTASCQRQGVPLTITDPTVITQIATIFGASAQQSYRRSRASERHSMA